jgi:uncharacterized protein
MSLRALCVSIHDVAPQTLDACRYIAEQVRHVEASVPLTLLVVPRYHGDTTVPAEYVEWVGARLSRGDELALHGYTHQDDAARPQSWREYVRRNVYTAREGEFAALTCEEAARRIADGRRWFAERGWPVCGFVAPAWLVSRGTWDALRHSDFLYTTTLGRFHVMRSGVSVRAPSVVYSTRKAWRRWTSRAWNVALFHTAKPTSLIRVGFHPADANYPDVMKQGLELLHRCLADREPLTKSAFAQRLC